MCLPERVAQSVAKIRPRSVAIPCVKGFGDPSGAHMHSIKLLRINCNSRSDSQTTPALLLTATDCLDC
jgi:hypothetical protein